MTVRHIQVFLLIMTMVSGAFAYSTGIPEHAVSQGHHHTNSDTVISEPRALDVEFGAELFAKHGLQSGKTMAGIGAIMVDADLRISQTASGFGAFHFDGRSWYNYLNRGTLGDVVQEEEDALHVEELFVLWEPIPLFELKVGRRYSRFSPVNQLHLADFEFSAKPRVFTTYMGDNHGLGVDGISMQWNLKRNKHHLYWLTEASKNSLDTRDLMLTSTVGYRREGLKHTLSWRGFAIFDNEAWKGHRLLGEIHPKEYAKISLRDEMALNTYGTSIVFDHGLGGGRNLRLQGEYISQQISNSWYRGGYAFAHYHFRPGWQVNLMYQALQVPELHPKFYQLHHHHEQAITAGIAYLPNPDQRIRLEYTTYINSIHYTDAVLLKYTFMVRR